MRNRAPLISAPLKLPVSNQAIQVRNMRIGFLLVLSAGLISCGNQKQIEALQEKIFEKDRIISDCQNAILAEQHIINLLDSEKNILFDHCHALNDSIIFCKKENPKAVAYINEFDKPFMEILKKYPNTVSDDKKLFWIIGEGILFDYGRTHKDVVDTIKNNLGGFDRKIITLQDKIKNLGARITLHQDNITTLHSKMEQSKSLQSEYEHQIVILNN